MIISMDRIPIVKVEFAAVLLWSSLLRGPPKTLFHARCHLVNHSVLETNQLENVSINTVFARLQVIRSISDLFVLVDDRDS